MRLVLADSFNTKQIDKILVSVETSMSVCGSSAIMLVLLGNGRQCIAAQMARAGLPAVSRAMFKVIACLCRAVVPWLLAE
jgi:hypothetical protein